MDKKDIYEHLAKIYLDASLKRKKKKREYPAVFKNIFFIIVLLAAGFVTSLITNLNKSKSLNSEIALVLTADTVKINFNFDPAKKEIYAVSLNKLDLSCFRALEFSTKKANYKDNISLRVEFISSFREKSEVYFKDIPHKWQTYKINLSEFKNISDWSRMLALSFIVEEWNARQKQDIVYIDNIRLLR